MVIVVMYMYILDALVYITIQVYNVHVCIQMYGMYIHVYSCTFNFVLVQWSFLQAVPEGKVRVDDAIVCQVAHCISYLYGQLQCQFSSEWLWNKHRTTHCHYMYICNCLYTCIATTSSCTLHTCTCTCTSVGYRCHKQHATFSK